MSVAEAGYVDRSGAPSNLAFFPLYPLLIKIVAAPFGGGRAALVAAGIAISTAALVLALTYLVRLARLDVGAASARRAAIYVLTYPTTILLSAVYPESTFLALAVAAFWCARRDRWALAGVLSGLAALTRPYGVVVALGLAAELGARPASRRGLTSWAWLGLGPLAFAGWAAYLYWWTGRPLAVLDSHGAWSVRPGDVVGAVAGLFDPRVYGFPWAVLALAVLMIFLSVRAWRLRTSYGIYSVLMLAALASPGTLTSSMRHELGLFPAFIVLGALGARTTVHWGWLAISGVMSLFFAAMFALSHWIG